MTPSAVAGTLAERTRHRSLMAWLSAGAGDSLGFCKGLIRVGRRGFTQRRAAGSGQRRARGAGGARDEQPRHAGGPGAGDTEGLSRFFRSNFRPNFNDPLAFRRNNRAHFAEAGLSRGRAVRSGNRGGQSGGIGGNLARMACRPIAVPSAASRHRDRTADFAYPLWRRRGREKRRGVEQVAGVSRILARGFPASTPCVT